MLIDRPLFLFIPIVCCILISHGVLTSAVFAYLRRCLAIRSKLLRNFNVEVEEALRASYA